MRNAILFLALAGAGLAVGCSDNSGHTNTQSAAHSSSNGEKTSIKVNLEEDSASYSNGQTSISVDAEDSHKKKSK